MKLKEFDYYLPKDLIAQKPIKPRDHSRLLILSRKNGRVEYKRFYNILDCLKAGDVLVFNNSKVMPARLIGHKKGTGGKVEILLHKVLKKNIWECLIGGKAKEKQIIIFEKGLECKTLKNNNDGTWEIEFNKRGDSLMKVVEKIGLVPLPPYIKRELGIRNPSNSAGRQELEKNDKNNYQTIYAEKIGSVAAPTAGLHFTPELIKKIKQKGVQCEYVTLHVGLGTFAPVKVDDIKKHKMHAEWVEADKETVKRIFKAKKEGRRIIAVGTTGTRTLEAIGSKKQEVRKKKYQDWVDIFIYPGYKFKIVDAMITNFHLPKSTLLMLVSAFAGKKNIDKAYEIAIKNKYRFYSYGDVMFIF